LIKIATHNKIFHADEVTAIALLEVFLNFKTKIIRVDHNSRNFSEFDMVIDVSRKFDGKKYFDHHQNKGGKSSAGLIWDFIDKKELYPSISKLIEMVDKQDVGEQKAGEFEYPNLIKRFNQNDVFSIEQEKAFNKAIEFAKTILISMKKEQEELNKTKEKIKNLNFLTENVVYFDKFVPHLDKIINAESMPNIKAIVWKDSANKYKIKLTSKSTESFEFNTKPLKSDKDMEFVHSSGFYAIARNKTIMMKFIQKNLG